MMNVAMGTVYFDRKGMRCQVVDYLVTRNLAGEVVRERYVVNHIFAGQVVSDNDVVETTILRRLAEAA